METQNANQNGLDDIESTKHRDDYNIAFSETSRRNVNTTQSKSVANGLRPY